MNKEIFLQVIRAIREDKGEEVFTHIRQSFDDLTALEALSDVINNDEKVYGILLNALGTREDCENLLSTSWEHDRIIEARPKSLEFFFYITLQNDCDDKFRIGCSVTLNKGISTVWYHHIVTQARVLDPQRCVDWDSVKAADEAMWTLLVSKIYGLSHDWFVSAAKAANDSLLVPYDLDL